MEGLWPTVHLRRPVDALAGFQTRHAAASIRGRHNEIGRRKDRLTRKDDRPVGPFKRDRSMRKRRVLRFLFDRQYIPASARTLRNPISFEEAGISIRIRADNETEALIRTAIYQSRQPLLGVDQMVPKRLQLILDRDEFALIWQGRQKRSHAAARQT